MPKYYVSCGCHHLLVLADCAESAALRLLDESFGEQVWVYDDAGLTGRERREHLALEALLHLGAQVRVSERGFGRSDAGTFEVPDLLDHWDKLMTAINKLFAAAGLAPRRVFLYRGASKHAESKRAPR